MNTRTETKEVLNVVARMVKEVIGEDWAEDLEITMKTSFARDLELESIEFVALAEKLKGVYGRRIDFSGWLSSMDLKDIIALEVGTLVDFIVASLAQDAAE